MHGWYGQNFYDHNGVQVSLYMVDSASRGILTEQDREYLLGEAEFKPNYERRIRQRIRNRILIALMDFSYIRYLKDTDLEQIFDPSRGKQSQFANPNRRGFPETKYTHIHEQYRSGPVQEGGGIDEPEPATTVFEEMLIDAISFLYRGAENLPSVDFERVVERGLTKSLQDHNKIASVEIDIRDTDIDRLMKKINEENINREELKYLLQNELEEQ